jgi:hypothetical protein
MANVPYGMSTWLMIDAGIAAWWIQSHTSDQLELI